jgi:Cytochrome P460
VKTNLVVRAALPALAVIGVIVTLSALASPGDSFIPGPGVNIQFMVKDSKKYAATGGWGFGDFTDGKPGDEKLMKTCFACYLPAKDRDFVFTKYAP